MYKDPIPIEHFWLMQMLGNFRQNETYILFFLVLPPPCLKTVSAPLRRPIFIDTTNKFSISKNWNIAHNIMCFIMNAIIARQNFSAILIYLSISKFSYRQNIF